MCFPLWRAGRRDSGEPHARARAAMPQATPRMHTSRFLNHRQVLGPSKTRRNFTSEILEKKGVGNGGNVTDVHMPLHSVFFIRDTVKF